MIDSEQRIYVKETRPPSSLDAIFVLGHNKSFLKSDRDIWSDPHHLSFQTKLNLHASAILCEEKSVDTLVFSTGQTSGVHMPTESYAMDEYWEKKFPHLSHVKRILETKSFNTNGNGAECLKISIKYNFVNAGILSTGVHVRNALGIFNSLGHNIQEANLFESEMVVAKHMCQNGKVADARKFLRDFYDYTLLTGDNLQETIRARLLQIDPQSKVLHAITSVTRNSQTITKSLSALFT